MKKIFLILLGSILFSEMAICRTVDQVNRMPPSGNLPGWGALNLNGLNATTGFLPAARFYLPNVQKFTTGGASGTYGLSYYFVVTSANATTGATYSNNSKVFTVVNTIAAGTQLLCTGTGAPSSSGTLTRTGGSGDATITFSYEAAPLYLETYVVAGGGGGGASVTGTGGTGGDTTFGAATAIGGSGGSAAGGNGGASGGASSVPANSQTITIYNNSTAGRGQGGMPSSGASTGGMGGASCLGSGGPGSNGANTGLPGQYGGGGGGAGGSASASGAGGGAGGCIHSYVYSPSATYAYSIGSGASGGTGSGQNGGTGGDGALIVMEHWQ